MSDILSKIERDIVINYLKETLPKLLLKPISTKYIPSEKNEAEFSPLVISQGSYSIISEGIILLSRQQTQRILADKINLSVFFYYNNRGLFFETSFRHVKNGFALVISPYIFKQISEGNGILQNAKLILSQPTINNNQINIVCTPNDNFQLFSNIKTSDVVSNFFTINIDTNDTPAFLGRITPPMILYLSDKEFLIGLVNNQQSFSIGDTFLTSIVIPSIVINRIINAEVQIDDKYTDESNSEKMCYHFIFTKIQMEDVRFLNDQFK